MNLELYITQVPHAEHGMLLKTLWWLVLEERWL